MIENLAFPGHRAAIPVHGFLRLLAAVTWRHRWIHALAFSSLALAAAVGARTGNMPNMSLVADFGFYIGLVFVLAAVAFSVHRLFRLAVVERNPAPLSAFVRSFVAFFADRNLIANSLNGLVALVVFSSAFSVLKGSIAVLRPFSWDERLARLDRALHLGHAPHEWLWRLLETPFVVYSFNVAYNFWFVILVGSMMTAAIARKDTKLRHQFLISLIVLWIGAGFFVATGFSSAGPAYYSRLGLGNDYQALMDALAAANTRYEIWALSTQDILWQGYTGATTGSVGISAFPSVHVISAVLFALYASRLSRVVGNALWIFAGIIMVGSVVLGWHYAVDGYAGALIALLVWKGVGFLLDRNAELKFEDS